MRGWSYRIPLSLAIGATAVLVCCSVVRLDRLPFIGSDEPSLAPGIACSLDGVEPQSLTPLAIGVSAKEVNSTTQAELSAQALGGLLADAGVRTIGTKLHWERVEAVEGTLDWSETDRAIEGFHAAGLEPLVTLRGTAPWASSRPRAGRPERFPPSSLAQWSRFVRTAVERYRDRVSEWEIWNEPNSDEYFVGSPADYVAILDAAFEVIRDVDPDAKVWAPAITFHKFAKTSWSFLDTVLESDGYDGISIHVYDDDLETVAQTVRRVRQTMNRAGKRHLPLIVTEVNRMQSITDCIEYNAQSPLELAELVRDTYACLLNSGADRVYWFKATDHGLYCDVDFDYRRTGLLNEYLEPKLAYDVLERFTQRVTATP